MIFAFELDICFFGGQALSGWPGMSSSSDLHSLKSSQHNLLAWSFRAVYIVLLESTENYYNLYELRDLC